MSCLLLYSALICSSDFLGGRATQPPVHSPPSLFHRFAARTADERDGRLLPGPYDFGLFPPDAQVHKAPDAIPAAPWQ